MIQVRKNAENHMVWHVNSGDCSFWWDNWTHKGSLAALVPVTNKSPKILVKDFIQNGEWNIHKLKSILPESLVQHIIEIHIGKRTILDKICWDLSEDGNYSNKTALEMIRTSKPKELILSKVKALNDVHKLVLQITLSIMLDYSERNMLV
ncbi:PREDICTED: uncharacterized protein LOC109207401 [Nicotiana attenuata]|uniref:uncharacterized protein LOC109207401 n=1 Tax=Nicotiana attenuata TaxID=49451 RepID=UPI000904AE29|nr:PREDICTED: uncharacterized protein LOC109207401 [Nicotiana attenuata]